jgi:hypothetical protein
MKNILGSTSEQATDKPSQIVKGSQVVFHTTRVKPVQKNKKNPVGKKKFILKGGSYRVIKLRAEDSPGVAIPALLCFCEVY